MINIAEPKNPLIAFVAWLINWLYSDRIRQRPWIRDVTFSKDNLGPEEVTILDQGEVFSRSPDIPEVTEAPDVLSVTSHHRQNCTPQFFTWNIIEEEKALWRNIS